MNNNVSNNGDSEVATILSNFGKSNVVPPQQVQHQHHHRPSNSYDAEAFYNAYVKKGLAAVNDLCQQRQQQQQYLPLSQEQQQLQTALRLIQQQQELREKQQQQKQQEQSSQQMAIQQITKMLGLAPSQGQTASASSSVARSMVGDAGSRSGIGGNHDATAEKVVNDTKPAAAAAAAAAIPTSASALQILANYQTAIEAAGEGGRIAPCHARGMPKNHNAKTAFFILYKGMKHGEALLCSHKDCAERGVRFLFCSVCDHPVAVGNFSSRHAHQDVLGKAKKSSKMHGSNGSIVSKLRSKSKKKRQAPPSYHQLPTKKQKARLAANEMLSMTMASRNKITDDEVAQSSTGESESASGNAGVDNAGNDNISEAGTTSSGNGSSSGHSSGSLSGESPNSSCSNSSEESDADDVDETDNRRKRGRDQPSMNVVNTTTVIPADDYGTESKRGMRTAMWLKLLSKRPRDAESDEMSAWLMAAVAVSDPSGKNVNNPAVRKFIGDLNSSDDENRDTKMPPSKTASSTS